MRGLVGTKCRSSMLSLIANICLAPNTFTNTAICVSVDKANMPKGYLGILKNAKPIVIQVGMCQSWSSRNSDFGAIRHYW